VIQPKICTSKAEWLWRKWLNKFQRITIVHLLVIIIIIIIIVIVVVVVVVVIGKDTISFMQSIYTYIPEINHVTREYSVAAILLLLLLLLLLLFSLAVQPSVGYGLLGHKVS
jgi:predicted PurR-regulated permease PerM